MPKLHTRANSRPYIDALSAEIDALDSPLPSRGLQLTAEERAHLSNNISLDEAGCWIWRDQRDKYGVARFRGRSWSAHRLLLALFTEHLDMASSLHVHHRCEVRGCVRPDHLMLVNAQRHSDEHKRIRRDRIAA